MSAAFSAWAPGYDVVPNPLLALEERILKPRLDGSVRHAPAKAGVPAGAAVLDLGTGTGRWLRYFLARGADAIGLDHSPHMLAVAAAKHGLRSRLALADLHRLPFADDCADFAVCAFSLSYLADLRQALREFARVVPRLVLSDMHPAAEDAGWTRPLPHFRHSKAHIQDAAERAGFELQWSIEACFEDADEEIFARAGKTRVFASVRFVPAVLISSWERA